MTKSKLQAAYDRKDQYVKYPLTILNKDTVPWRRVHMQSGGSQLIEILEKEISLDYIQDHQKELSITDLQLEKLDSLLRNNMNITPVMKEFGCAQEIGVKNFYYRGNGMLGRLLRKINPKPIFNADYTAAESIYTFIDYEIVNNGEILMAMQRLKKDKFLNASDNVKTYINRTWFCKNVNGEWLDIPANCQDALDMKYAYDLVDRLIM